MECERSRQISLEVAPCLPDQIDCHNTIALLACGAQARDQHLTAREVIARIQQQVGVPWQSDTVDTFKAGNPDSPVSGVAVTMMATLDVL